eukprot:358225_1
MNPLTMYEVSVLAQYIKSMYEVLAPSRAPSGSSSQPPTDDMEELVFQIIRDMTQVFCIVLSMWMMRYIFGITKAGKYDTAFVQNYTVFIDQRCHGNSKRSS